MKKSSKIKPISMKTCSLCNKSSEAEGISLIYFGEWMVKKEVTVHYFCLLLSTHLPQKGEDHSGILGFLLRDIRQEIALAKKRKCKYCHDMCASVQCCVCKEYFHLTCGHTSKCLSQFVGEFKSYCHACWPQDKFQMKLFARAPPQTTQLCFICSQIMGTNPKSWIYAKCCGNGFTHAKCMKIYALSAGYYLTCIWCKNKQFREDIKYQGIFVPDREANWEKEKGAYGELYQGHKRCDMEVCHCPKGRNYINAFRWQLITCKFCGAFGAHNPACIPGLEGTKEKITEFKCDVCSVTEQTVLHKSSPTHIQDLIDTSLYVSKDARIDSCESEPSITEPILFNNNSSCDSVTSQQTVINVNSSNRHTLPAILDKTKSVKDVTNFEIAARIFTLTQSPQDSQQHEIKENTIEDIGSQEESSDSDDSVIVNMLVQKLLDVFEKK